MQLQAFESKEGGFMELDYAKLAEELGKVLKDKHEEQEQIHAEQHRIIGEMIPYAPLLIEIAEEMREKREARKRLVEKLMGALIIGAVISACGWVGSNFIGYLSERVSQHEVKQIETHNRNRG